MIWRKLTEVNYKTQGSKALGGLLLSKGTWINATRQALDEHFHRAAIYPLMKMCRSSAFNCWVETRWMCFFLLSMGTPVSQHLTSGSDTERREKKKGPNVWEQQKNKAPVAVTKHGSSNILPSFSEQRGSSAFDIWGERLAALGLVTALALARAASLYIHVVAPRGIRKGSCRLCASVKFVASPLICCALSGGHLSAVGFSSTEQSCRSNLRPQTNKQRRTRSSWRLNGLDVRIWRTVFLSHQGTAQLAHC